MTPSRALASLAVSTLLVATAAACGDDTGDEPTASDPTTSAATSTSPSGSPTTTDSPTASASPTDSGDPVQSPVITKAVKKALAARFPALVPAGVPAGWTVEQASYQRGKGGTWRIELTAPSGAVTLVQTAQELDAFLAANLAGGMQQTGTVDLGEYGTGEWQVYTGAGATAIVTQIARTSALVSGPDQDTVVELAEQLLTAEDAGAGTGDG